MAKRARTRNNSPVNKAPSVELKMLKSEFSDAQLEHYLNKGTIDSLEEIDTPPQILWVEDCTIATFGNFSASTGKAKSKKTFNISAMVAAALINGKVLNYRASLPEGKRKILYFDTEQSRYHCRKRLRDSTLSAKEKRLIVKSINRFSIYQEVNLCISLGVYLVPILLFG